MTATSLQVLLTARLNLYEPLIHAPTDLKIPYDTKRHMRKTIVVILLLHYLQVWYGIVEFNVPLDTVLVISEMGYLQGLFSYTITNPSTKRDTLLLPITLPNADRFC